MSPRGEGAARLVLEAIGKGAAARLRATDPAWREGLVEAAQEALTHPGPYDPERLGIVAFAVGVMATDVDLDGDG